MLRVIGLLGNKGTGKDEVADELVRLGGWVKVGVSDPLHRMLLKIDPFVDSGMRYSQSVETLGYVGAKKIPEVRRLLQVLGTDVIRETVDPYFWADCMARAVRREIAAGNNVVVTGIRYWKDLYTLLNLPYDGEDVEAEIIRVVRPTLDVIPDPHSSENELTELKTARTIVNDGTLENLREKVRELW